MPSVWVFKGMAKSCRFNKDSIHVSLQWWGMWCLRCYSVSQDLIQVLLFLLLVLHLKYFLLGLFPLLSPAMQTLSEFAGFTFRCSLSYFSLMGKQISLNSLISPVLLCISATTPWFESYRECFLQSMPASDHEFLNHYVACILWILQTAPGKTVTKCNVGDTEHFAVTLSQLWFEAYIFFHYVWLHRLIS